MVHSGFPDVVSRLSKCQCQFVLPSLKLKKSLDFQIMDSELDIDDQRDAVTVVDWVQQISPVTGFLATRTLSASRLRGCNGQTPASEWPITAMRPMAFAWGAARDVQDFFPVGASFFIWIRKKQGHTICVDDVGYFCRYVFR